METAPTRATIMTDLSYGDTGKGTTTEYLAAQSDSAVVIRFNGGGQAAHNVVTPDNRHHTFSQIGAGCFQPGVATHLSRDMLINPINMTTEVEHLEELGVRDVWERTSVDESAKIVTPFQRAGNRLRELARGVNRHGSTGQGISELILDDMIRPHLVLRAGDIAASGLRGKLEAIRIAKRDQFHSLGRLLADDTPDWEALNDPDTSEWYAELYHEWAANVRIVAGNHLAQLALEYSHLIFEPAQGILLDEKRGFHPHTTWSNTTPDNARRQLADVQFDGDVRTLGIVRAYTTRHGDGPFVTEDTQLDEPLRDSFNVHGPWQGKFRIGHFDSVAHRYAASAAGKLDGLVITCIDQVQQMPEWKYCTSYRLLGHDDIDAFFDRSEGNVATDIKLARYGDKEHMKRLTELLFQVEPVYDTVSSPTNEDIIHTIEEQVGVQAVLASYGPTINDKVELC